MFALDLTKKGSDAVAQTAEGKKTKVLLRDLEDTDGTTIARGGK